MEEENRLEEQNEELEVLQSIYEGDPNFKLINDHTFQYKYGNEGEATSLLLEIEWPEVYPVVAPRFNVNAFYNNHISQTVKTAVVRALVEEAEKDAGSQQTYTLIEWARENTQILIHAHMLDDNSAAEVLSLEGKPSQERSESGEAKSKDKKESLTKSQKRKEWDRLDSKGEKLRGHDWVDVVKHLSQTGGKPDMAVAPAEPQ